MKVFQRKAISQLKFLRNAKSTFVTNPKGLHKNFGAEEAVKYAKDNGAVVVSYRFTDTFGKWQQMTTPISQLSAEEFKSGKYFDGSSIRGWQGIEKSDMVIVPDATTVTMDPFNKHPTVCFICDVIDAIDLTPYQKDPRTLAKRSTDFLKSTGIASECRIGAEAEFFLFDDVRYQTSPRGSSYSFDNQEGYWNLNREEKGGNKAYKIRAKEGYVPLSPSDHHQDIRDQMMMVMQQVGLLVETGHHEVASGQHEIDIKYDELTKSGDNMMWYKYIVKNVANQNGLSATFMPKPNYEDNGSGMHTHVSVHDQNGKNLMIGDGHCGLSEVALHFIGGIIKNSDALLAITNPTTNSYRRLVPGFEAPVFNAYSARNRSAFIRIPTSHSKARRFEFRTPDPSANPYISFAAILMAGIDGVLNKISPGDPTDKNLYELSAEDIAKFKRVPHSLEHALDALSNNRSFLTQGGVFSDQFVDDYVEYKYKHEVTPNRRVPTSKEFELYYDC